MIRFWQGMGAFYDWSSISSVNSSVANELQQNNFNTQLLNTMGSLFLNIKPFMSYATLAPDLMFEVFGHIVQKTSPLQIRKSSVIC